MLEGLERWLMEAMLATLAPLAPLLPPPPPLPLLPPPVPPGTHHDTLPLAATMGAALGEG